MKRNLWRIVGVWLMAAAGVALWPESQAAVGAQEPGVATSGMSAAAKQAGAGYWTAEMMARAIPMDRTADASRGVAGPAVQNLGEGAAPGLAPGFDPARALAKTAEAMRSGPFAIMTSPPFAPPATPTDYGNYAPFQRWTHFGNYRTYPISTMGKLFFTQNGLNYVCSASVINTNTIATAGHCVSDGTSTFSTNFAFCPSYTPSGCTFGVWNGIGAVTSTAWHVNGNIDRDYACIITNQPGGVTVGGANGTTGRAWNWPTRQLEFALGYPQGAPFNGTVIITTASTEWYQIDMDTAGELSNPHLSKYIGSDQTGGSSGGPWWLSYRHPNGAFDYPDTDGSALTDPGSPGGPYINGLNSHKRCAGNCNNPPAGGLFWQEMGSPQFLNTTGDGGESEDVFAACFNSGGQ